MSNSAQIIGVVQSLVGAMLLFLLGLALRNRFRMKWSLAALAPEAEIARGYALDHSTTKWSRYIEVWQLDRKVALIKAPR